MSGRFPSSIYFLQQMVLQSELSPVSQSSSNQTTSKTTSIRMFLEYVSCTQKYITGKSVEHYAIWHFGYVASQFIHKVVGLSYTVHTCTGICNVWKISKLSRGYIFPTADGAKV